MSPKSADFSDTTLKPGQRIAGRYRIQRLLGRGGMGIVFLAKHEAIGQLVALKVLTERAASDEENVERFLKEARASARIRGEHVVKIMDVGRLPNRSPYIAMEYLQGEDLAQRLERAGPLAPSEACSYLLDAIHTLVQAHAIGIVHRDLKPSNLFLEQQPTRPPVLKVLDFGIAKMEEGDASARATSTGTIMGTPSYMAPEQMRSSRSVDGRADVWALGVIAYEIMSGRLPFVGESLGDILVAVVEGRALPLHQVAPAVPLALSEMVSRCLQRDPAHRFQDVASLAEALEPFAGAEGPSKVQAIRLLAMAVPEPLASHEALPSVSPTSADSDSGASARPWSGLRGRRREALVGVGTFVTVALVVSFAAHTLRTRATSSAGSTVPAGPTATASTPASSTAAAANPLALDGAAPLVADVADGAAPSAVDAGAAPATAPDRPALAAPRGHGRSGSPSGAASHPAYTDDPTWNGLKSKP